MQVIDTRSPEAIAGTYLSGTLAIPMNMIPAFAGWFLSYDQPIGLIVESPSQLDVALRHLYRLGYDDITGYLAGGLHTWEAQGKPYDGIGVVHAQKLQNMLERDESFTLLDVRSAEEYQQKHLPDSINIYVGHLPSKLHEVPKDKPIVTFCGSGRRAIIAASILKMNGFEHVSDCLGSMKACSKIGCDLVK
jgi:hydroxyacylglutathione hydrolase